MSTVPAALSEIAAKALQWAELQEQVSKRAQSAIGRARVLALRPSGDLGWIETQQQRTEELRRLVVGGGGFDFRGIFDVSEVLDKARIEGSALETGELLAALSA